MRLLEKDIAIIRDYFKQKPVLKAYVFGSHARGDARKDSDIDILVELDYSQHIGLGFVQMKLDLEDKLHRAVDLVSHKGLSNHILPFIEKDKELIYENSSVLT